MLTTDDIVPYCGLVLARSEKPGGLILVVQRLKKRISQAFHAQWTALRRWLELHHLLLLLSTPASLGS